MSTPPRSDDIRGTASEDRLPSVEELQAMYTENELIYGIHILLDDGEEECLVDTAPSAAQPDGPPPAPPVPPAHRDRADDGSPGK